MICNKLKEKRKIQKRESISQRKYKKYNCDKISRIIVKASVLKNNATTEFCRIIVIEMETLEDLVSIQRGPVSGSLYSLSSRPVSFLASGRIQRTCRKPNYAATMPNAPSFDSRRVKCNDHPILVPAFPRDFLSNVSSRFVT